MLAKSQSSQEKEGSFTKEAFALVKSPEKTLTHGKDAVIRRRGGTWDKVWEN